MNYSIFRIFMQLFILYRDVTILIPLVKLI